MRGYRSAADYYDNYLFGRSPQEVERKECDDSKNRRDAEERTRQEMIEHQRRYGD